MERFYFEEKRARKFEEWLQKIKLSEKRIENVVIILSIINRDFKNQLCGLDSLYLANTEIVVDSIINNLLSDPVFIDINRKESDDYFNAIQLYHEFIALKLNR